MLSSFIIDSNYFKSPETHKIVRESGIEDRYKTAFICTDNNFSVTKDDWSDGVIRYTKDGEIKFYGIQECKRLVNSHSIYSRIVQGLAYVYDFINAHPDTKSKFKVLILPTELFIDVIYLDDIINSQFWIQFQSLYEQHKALKGSASNFYSKSFLVRDLVISKKFSGFHKVIDKPFDFKVIVEEILHNCL